jgi:hypothetical protein
MYKDEKAGQNAPFERTACHSSSFFWTGNDILEELLELKRLPMKGIEGIDLKTVLWVNGWKDL